MPGLRIVIAPDSFKGSATAADASRAIAEGWSDVRPHDDLVLIPMADGGEGTLDALASAVPGAIRMPLRVDGPVGRGGADVVDAEWLLLPASSGRSGTTGVVELASASGILLLDQLAPMTAHTRGFGQLIRGAIDHGVDRLLLAIGGSASTDGGTGALTVLGARFLDAKGAEIGPGGGGVETLARVDLDDLVPVPPHGAVVLSDVTNTLTGTRGAAAVFGPQKGATAEQVVLLDAALERLAGLMPGDPDAPGAGAAGGTGFGLLCWGASLDSGAAVVADALGLDTVIARADLVITGEGSFDDQSGDGKVPAEVAATAWHHGVPVAVVAGRISADVSHLVAAVSLTALAGTAERAQSDAMFWLREAGRQLASRT